MDEVIGRVKLSFCSGVEVQCVKFCAKALELESRNRQIRTKCITSKIRRYLSEAMKIAGRILPSKASLCRLEAALNTGLFYLWIFKTHITETGTSIRRLKKRIKNYFYSVKVIKWEKAML